MQSWRRNLYILISLQFLVVGAMSMIVPFLPLYLRELGIKDQEKLQLWSGIIYGINFFSAFLVAPIWGNLADRFGRKMMVLRSGFGMMVVIFLTGLVTSPLQLFVLRLLNGTVSGFIPASISLVATNTPKEHVGYALGLLQSGVVAGLIMGPSLGGFLAELIGFRSIFFLTSVIIGIASIIAWLKVKEEFQLEKEAKRFSFWQESSFILQQRSLLFLFIIGMLLQLAMMGPVAQMSLFISKINVPGGYTVFFSGLVFAMTGLSNIIFTPLIGRLGDRLGAEKVFLITLLVTAIGFIPHSFVQSIWLLLVVRFFLGMSMGGLLPSLSVLIRKHSPPGRESTAFGFHTSAICLGNLIGPMIYGLISNIIGLRGIFLVTSICLFFTALLFKLGLNRFNLQTVNLSKS
jgi:MFS transporter, DHA1 family, multidrug resistance protein